MASSPQTWKVLQGLQWVMQNELLVTPIGGGGAVNPFSLFATAPNPANPANASDQTRYGTNPNGTITNAIYIGVPKDWNTLYPAQCHIVATQEHAYRYDFGGKNRVEQTYLIRCHFNANDPATDWLTQEQNAINTADAIHTLIAKHANLPQTAPTVAASKMDPGHHGYFYDENVGFSWLNWQAAVWVRQEFNVTGGITA